MLVPGMWGKGGWKAEGQPPPSGAGKRVGTCEVISSINNTPELARPVPLLSSSEAIPVTQRIPNTKYQECEASFTPETSPTESAMRK